MAKSGINKVILVGNLGKDPEIRYNPNGNAIAGFSIATSESYKDKQGQTVEKTEWHNITIFGKLAEIGGEYLKKGSQVYLEGKLKTEKWTDKQGQERYTTKIIVDSFSGVMQMLGGKTDNQSETSRPIQQQKHSNVSQSQQGNQPAQEQGFNDNFDDDIPF